MLRRGLLCVSACLFILTSAGCGKRNAYIEPPPPKVIVGTPVVRSVTIYHEFPGTTQATQSVSITPRVLGYLDSLHFKDGATVTKGQLLFVIDPRPYQDAYDVAVAQVHVAEAAYREAQADNARAKAVAKTPGAISPQDLDKFQATEEQGQANLELARSNTSTAKLNLDFTHITAPVSGRISRRLVDIGNLVTANTTVLTTIDQYDPMYAYFNASETQFLEYLKQMRSEEDTGKSGGKTSIANQSTANKTPAEDKTTKNNSESSGISSAAPVPQSDESQIESMNRPVEMGLVTEKGFPHKGKIDFVDNRVDPNTGTILVRGLFANPPPYALAPGLFVRIRVPVGTQTGAILIPDRALSTDQQGQYLLVVRPDNVVEHRVVEVGSLEGQMRVITSGVKPGEQFIVEGLQFARPGGKVTPVAESTTATSNDGKADADAPAKTSDAKPAPDNSPPPATNPTNKSPADDGAPKNKSE